MNLIPDLTELISLRYPAQHLRFSQERSGLGLIHGKHRSRIRGRGLEFEEVRPYIAGDDARSIDWRVSARTGRIHTRLYREEKDRPVWIICNLSSSLFFGSRIQLKSALAVRLAALLCWIALQEGQRISLLIHHGVKTAHTVRTQSRQQGVLPLLKSLVDLQPRHIQPPGSLPLSASIKHISPQITTGSLLLLISDWLVPDPQLATALGILQPYNHLCLFGINDPLEQNGLADGTYSLGVPGGIQMWGGRRSRSVWPAFWQKKQQELQQMCLQLNLPMYSFSTTDDAAVRLSQWLNPYSTRITS